MASAGNPGAGSNGLEAETILRCLYVDMLRFARRLVADGVDPQDVVQDAAIKVALGINGFEGRSATRTWVLAITRNAAMDANRQARRARERLAPLDLAEAVPARHANAETDEQEWLRRQLMRMDEPMRETAALVLELGLTHAEAGAVLGVSGGTVSWRMSELRRALIEAAGKETAA